jgi:F-type H+-transporting ATPase subunit gamma
MAGVSTKEIKNRIRSMESTKQITKAMEMVAASKLRRAQTQVLSSRPYFETLYDTINQIVDTNQDFSSAYLTQRPVKKTAWIVIAGDRGLAGGYNSNVLKMAYAQMEGKEVSVLPIGKKTADFFRSHSCNIRSRSLL